MKAIAIVPGKGQASIVEADQPVLREPHQLLVRVLEVGICGTDREEASGGRADAPDNSPQLIIGHEMLGQVTEVGSAVTDVQPGDYGLFTVRRECGHCQACQNGRSDMCYSGDYTERGIHKRHGYQAAFVVDDAKYFVKVPAEIASIGVLTEPLSVVVKALDEANNIQLARLPYLKTGNWYEGRSVLVAGIGAVGLLAAVALRLRGANVFGLDIVEPDSLRPSVLTKIGGTYLDGRKVNTLDLDKTCGQIDAIFEAAGISKLQFELIDALGINGIYVVTGIPQGESSITIPGASLMSQLVLKNQLVLGSVNAAYAHYAGAVETLQAARQQWGNLIDTFITEKIPLEQFKKALEPGQANDIKTVVTWNGKQK